MNESGYTEDTGENGDNITIVESPPVGIDVYELQDWNSIPMLHKQELEEELERASDIGDLVYIGFRKI